MEGETRVFLDKENFGKVTGVRTFFICKPRQTYFLHVRDYLFRGSLWYELCGSIYWVVMQIEDQDAVSLTYKSIGYS